MRTFVERAFAELDASGAATTVVTVPVAPPRPGSVGAPRGAGPALVRWEDPAREVDGRAFCLVGCGEALRVQGSGEGRFDDVRHQASDAFAGLAARVHPDAAFAPPPRLLGGIAFRPEPVRTPPWTAFRDASFALPRVVRGVSGDRAFLQIARRAGEPVDVEALEALLEDHGDVAGDDSAPTADATATLARQSPDAWARLIGDALARIRAGELEKVVPMTMCTVLADEPLDPAIAVLRLAALYPECVRFAFAQGAATFVGASPERLVWKRGLSVSSDALAGSAPRRPDDAATRAAAMLLESDKDRREHAVVVEAVRAALAPFAARMTVPEAPTVRSLRNVHHLFTPITATLARPVHVLDLVQKLHPTPAVCGTPRDAAIRWIAAHEPEPRGWYAGAVGWFDADGDGAFSVAIRSGVLVGGEAWLYAGAGIVEGSDAALEYAETRAKQRPMLAALGLAP
jgi:menaquinone-specific isochorismate synthase